MVYPHAAYLLREFYSATNWSNDNHYGALTQTSRNLLDFPIPPGLHLSLAHRPTPTFASNLALSTLVPAHPVTYPASNAPVLGQTSSSLLAGQLTYVFSSAQLGLTSTKRSAQGRDRIRFRDVVQSFRTGELPVRPELRDEAQPTWLAGERCEKQDFLLYGRLYAPAPRLDALYVHRLTPTLQSLVSLISVPSPIASPTLTWQPNEESTSTASNTSSSSAASARLSELEVKLLQDTGRWSSEYSYAVGDGMWGVRGLYNFGKSGSGASETSSELAHSGKESEELAGVSLASVSGSGRERVVDEEEEMSTGLKGRWSAGGEAYFSAQERSAGVSTGVRFSTLPEGPGVPSQPPTTMTATLNPIMGQLSTAYSVAVSPDSALGSRFDFNLYSYDADLTVGGEWFQRRNTGAALVETVEPAPPPPKSWDAFGRNTEALEDSAAAVAPLPPSSSLPNHDKENEIIGVLKFRASTNTDLALLWEGRLGDFLVSLGVVADLRLAGRRGGRVSPIRSVGVGLQYWG